MDDHTIGSHNLVNIIYYMGWYNLLDRTLSFPTWLGRWDMYFEGAQDFVVQMLIILFKDITWTKQRQAILFDMA